MKFGSLQKRIENMEPEPVDPSEQKDVENDKLLMEAFTDHFLDQLRELGCSGVIEEVKAAFGTVGPRPFGHTRPDDHPYWSALELVERSHQDLSYRIRAAESLAWADVYIDFGEPEDSECIKSSRECAAYALKSEAKHNQTFCDKCGGYLGSWWCYSGNNIQKLCINCS